MKLSPLNYIKTGFMQIHTKKEHRLIIAVLREGDHTVSFTVLLKAF